jgi:hypothetical protein
MAREFLLNQQIEFIARDIFLDPDAKKEWETLGLDVVPVAVQGTRRLAVYNVDQLRGFLGLPPAKDSPPFQELVSALERVLEAVERAVHQVPAAHLNTPTPNRGRDLQELVFNIHNPIDLMRESLDIGRFDWSTADDFQLSRQFDTKEKLVDFCRQTRLRWLERAILVEASEVDTIVKTPRGDLSRQQLLEAQARHAAQHLRQIYVFLREIKIAPEDELNAEAIHPIKLGDQIF